MASVRNAKDPAFSVVSRAEMHANLSLEGHADTRRRARARAGRGLTTRDVVEAERPARWGAAFAVTEAEPAAQHTRYRAPPDVG